MLKLIQLYFSILSFVWPSLAARTAFKMFQKVRKKDIRKRELNFYKQAREIKVSHLPEDVFGYELGNPDGPIVILLHGWDSNAGSLSKIAFGMVDQGYRVLAMNMPGHAFAKMNHTNMFVAKNAFKAFINHIEPKEPLTFVTHSFGSAMLAYGLVS